MASDLHVAAAGLVALVNEPGTLEDFSLAVEAVRDALAAEDATGGSVETPAPAPVVAPVEEAPAVDPAPVLAVDSVPPVDPASAPAPVPATDAAHDTAVTVAEAAVAVAPIVEDKAAHLAAATADIDAALKEWPDSPQLQDLKTQLEALAG